MTRTLALLVSVLMTAPAFAQKEEPQPDRVKLVTRDNVTIIGDFYAGNKTAPSVILLHMYKSDRTAWAPLVPGLHETVASWLDERGFGPDRATRTSTGARA